jgi:hypothetical protein
MFTILLTVVLCVTISYDILFIRVYTQIGFRSLAKFISELVFVIKLFFIELIANLSIRGNLRFDLMWYFNIIVLWFHVLVQVSLYIEVYAAFII